ncbi:MAG: hypothetical protein AABW88_00140, partial [Nanoarchaeota archaeon]
MIDKYLEQLKTAIAKPNDYISQLSDYLKTGILPQREEPKPEINPLEQEIQGLKDKNYSYEDVNTAIDQDDSIQDKPIAKDFASKIYGIGKSAFQKFKDISGGTENERIFAKMERGEQLTNDEMTQIGMSAGGGFIGGMKNVAEKGVQKIAP